MYIFYRPTVVALYNLSIGVNFKIQNMKYKFQHSQKNLKFDQLFTKIQDFYSAFHLLLIVPFQRNIF